MTKDFIPGELPDEPEENGEYVPPLRNCSNCILRPNCSIRARAMMLEVVGGYSMVGGQRVAMPSMDNMPMPCGGDAWQPITVRKRSVRLFEDWNPNPVEQGDTVPYEQAGFTVNEQGLPE